MNILEFSRNNIFLKHHGHPPFVFTQVYRHVATSLSSWGDDFGRGLTPLLSHPYSIIIIHTSSSKSSLTSMFSSGLNLSWDWVQILHLCTHLSLSADWSQRKHTAWAIEGDHCCYKFPLSLQPDVFFTDIPTFPCPLPPESILLQPACHPWWKFLTFILLSSPNHASTPHL